MTRREHSLALAVRDLIRPYGLIIPMLYMYSSPVFLSVDRAPT